MHRLRLVGKVSVGEGVCQADVNQRPGAARYVTLVITSVTYRSEECFKPSRPSAEESAAAEEESKE
jgi:hypothetical protein